MSSRPADSSSDPDGRETQEQADSEPQTIEDVLDTLQEQRTAVSGLIRQVGALKQRAQLAAADEAVESEVEGNALTISFTVGSRDAFEQLLRFYDWDSIVAEPNPPAYDVELTIACPHSQVDTALSLEDPELALPQEM